MNILLGGEKIQDTGILLNPLFLFIFLFFCFGIKSKFLNASGERAAGAPQGGLRVR